LLDVLKTAERQPIIGPSIFTLLAPDPRIGTKRFRGSRFKLASPLTKATGHELQ